MTNENKIIKNYERLPEPTQNLDDMKCCFCGYNPLDEIYVRINIKTNARHYICPKCYKEKFSPVDIDKFCDWR